MPAPKGNQNAKGNKGGAGGKTRYKEEYAKIAYGMALLGTTDIELAVALDVDDRTIRRWKKVHVEFASALKEGKDLADSRVAKSLYNRALGYEVREHKVETDFEGREKKTVTTKQIPPDPTSAIFWLKNRQRENWRDRKDVMVSHKLEDMTDAELIQYESEIDAKLKDLAGNRVH